MNDDAKKDPAITAEDLAPVLHGLARSPGRRITSINISGRRVWIKRYDIEPLTLPKRLHWFLSPILYPVFLRGSEPAFGEAGVERECSKMAAFRAAGFAVPEVIYRSGATLILSDVSPILTQQLFGAPEEEKRESLAKLFSALGRVHGAGLVHGRPHLRDVSVQNGEICFFDFEEAPETAMPLADAQARDLWLLMLPLVDWAPDEETRIVCLKTWLATAPSPAVLALIRFLGFCRPVVAAARLLPARLGGSDLNRFLATARFLVASLSDMENALAATGIRAAAKQVDS